MVCDHYDDLFTFKTHNGAQALRLSSCDAAPLRGPQSTSSKLRCHRLPGSAVPLTCFPNGTGIYEVGAGGTCELSSSVAGKSQLLTVRL